MILLIKILTLNLFLIQNIPLIKSISYPLILRTLRLVFMTNPSIIAKLNIQNCIGCGACVEFCPKCAIPYSLIGFISSLAKIDANLCDGCGKCVEICSLRAIVMLKKNS